MKSLVPRLSLALVLLLAACASPDTATDSAAVGSTEVTETTKRTVPFEAAALTAEQQAFQDELLSAEGKRAVAEFRAAAVGVTDLDGFFRVFEEALGMASRIVDPEKADPYGEFAYTFQQADLGMPGLTPSCVAECTEPAIALEQDGWTAIAAATASPIDDEFVALVFDFWGYPQVYDGSLGVWPSFFERTWDYGGFSMLGGGQHAALMQRLDALGEGGAMTDYVNQMRSVLLSDITDGRCYGPGVDDMSAEVREIIYSGALTVQEEATLEKRLEVFASGDGIEPACAVDYSCSCASG